MSEYQNKRIDLVKFWRYLIKRWMLFVAFILLCAILGGLVSLAIDKYFLNSNEENIQEVSASLTSEERQQVEDAASLLHFYKEKYASQKEYIDNSIYQKIDALSVDCVTLNYYIDNYYQVSYPIIEKNNNLTPLLQAYISIMSNDELYNSISSEINSSIPSTYYSELVSVECDTSDNADGTFSVVIYGADKEIPEKIADIICNTLSENYGSISEKYGEHKLVLTSRTYEKRVDLSMSQAQQENISSINMISGLIKQLENSFTGDQSKYLQKLVHEQIEESVNYKKNIVIGILVGILIPFAYCSLKYILSPTLEDENELESNVGELPLIGVLDSKHLEETYKMTSAKVGRLIDISGYKNIALVYDSRIEEPLEFNLVNIVDVINNVDAFEKFKDSDAGILVVQLGKTRTDEVRDIIKLCEVCNMKLMGYIVKK